MASLSRDRFFVFDMLMIDDVGSMETRFLRHYLSVLSNDLGAI